MHRNGEGTIEKERDMVNANVSKLRSQVCLKSILGLFVIISYPQGNILIVVFSRDSCQYSV